MALKVNTAVIDTIAIQKPIDECAANGGGVVVVSPKQLSLVEYQYHQNFGCCDLQ